MNKTKVLEYVIYGVVYLVLLGWMGAISLRDYYIRKHSQQVPALVTDKHTGRAQNYSLRSGYYYHVLYCYQGKYYQSKVFIADSYPMHELHNINDTIVVSVCNNHPEWACFSY